ncbi:MAG: rod shape-determining protein MreC [Bacteroidetes bacterium]|nr:rod shape-determining protein MreC [Bacteroidota bacterium]MBP6316268.1 rod shape-determining protein MreC [Chitinophagaceae bacterium]
MRNILQLLKQFYAFILFLFIEFFCLVLVFQNNHYQQASAINSSNKISGFFYKKKEHLMSYFRLSVQNDSLVAENARLKRQLGISIKSNPLKDTSYVKEVVFDSTKQILQYDYLPAKVLNNTIDQKINYLTLNKGSADGIKKNMAVISEKGVVGKIANVSEHFSIATSVLSERFNVSVMTADGTVGKAVWDGKNIEFLTLSGIPQSVKLKPLDTIVTSGYSSIFPENILVGRIAKVESPTSYKIWLSSKFSNLHFVYIVKDVANEERIQLEEPFQE